MTDAVCTPKMVAVAMFNALDAVETLSDVMKMRSPAEYDEYNERSAALCAQALAAYPGGGLLLNDEIDRRWAVEGRMLRALCHMIAHLGEIFVLRVTPQILERHRAIQLLHRRRFECLTTNGYECYLIGTPPPLVPGRRATVGQENIA